MYVLDLSDPENPAVAASFDYSEEEVDVPLLVLLGEEIGFGEPGYKHLVEFNLDTGETELLSSFQFPQHANQPTGNQAFRWTGHFSDWGVGDEQDVIFSGDYNAGVQVFDATNPTDPIRIAHYYTNDGTGQVRREKPNRAIDETIHAWGAESQLAGDSGRVYVSDVNTGFYIFELKGY